MNNEIQLKLNNENAYPKINLPHISARPRDGYTITTGPAYTGNTVNINKLVSKSNNADLFFNIESNGIKVKKAGWYLVMASASFNTNVTLGQSELLVEINNNGVGWSTYRGGTVGINQTTYPSQLIYIEDNKIVKIDITSSIAGISMEIFERSIISLIRISD